MGAPPDGLRFGPFRLDADADFLVVATDFVLIGVALQIEQFEARRGDDTRRDALRLQQFAGFHRDRDFSAGGVNRHTRRIALGAQQFVGAFGAQIFAGVATQAGHCLARER